MTGTKEVSHERGAKPTPGPWRVHQHYHAGGELWLSIGNFTHDGAASPEGRWIGPVAELKYLGTREDEQWANARLIAAAPELLVFAKKVIAEKWLNDEFAESDLDYDGMVALAVAAIAKAEGK